MPARHSPARLFAICVLTLATAACGPSDGSAPGTPDDPLALGQRVPFPTEGWTVSSPEGMGMDSAVLEGLFEYAFAPSQNTQGVVVIRGGAIVAERYAEGADRSTFGTSWSAGKSFASALIGIAMNEGLIESVDVPMTTFYPGWAGTEKEGMTLRDVLQAQSGLDFVEDYANLETSDVLRMGLSEDALDYVMNRPLANEPGKKWYYSSGDTMLLSGVIEQVTGKSARDYAREKLFAPLGMTDADWWTDGRGHAQTWCCVDAPTREFAKLGLLFLRGGAWDGHRVVTEEWVRASTTDAASNYSGYAYQWWTADVDSTGLLPRDMYSARGYDDQRIYVIPSLDLVIARHAVYRKPPGDEIAPKGVFSMMQGRSVGDYGTMKAELWQDQPFLVPAINSIEAFAQKIDPSRIPGIGKGEASTAVCRSEAVELGGFCEPVHGCACDTCAAQFLDCNEDPGCKEIVACALDSGCRSVECVTACGAQIEKHGGVFGPSASLATRLDECVAPCATSCSG